MEYKNKGNDKLNAIRLLGVEAINKANSGHPGIVLDASPMMFSIYTNEINVDVKDPLWFNRDRFVLSAGHGSAMLYSMLHLVGYDVTMDDMKNFRQLNSRTPGHPERDPKRGIEVTTGPLGQGVGMGVGLALAESILGAKFNKPDAKVVDHYTYVLCGDGDLEEGVSYETISFAGRNQLNKLILLHDSNDVQLDDYVKAAQTEDMMERFKSANWNTILVEDGEDTDAITKAIEQAKKSDKPTYIQVKTVIGLGATKLQGGLHVHGAPLGDNIADVKTSFGWDHPDFEIPSEVYDFYKETTQARGTKAHDAWNKAMDDYKAKYPNEYKELMNAINDKYDVDWSAIKSGLDLTKKEATRVSSGNVFNLLRDQIKTLVGGSADLSGSTKIAGADGKYGPDNRTGRNIMYGVREFGMAAINNGMSAHGGILPIASGFFIFSDYMKAAIRMSALMQAKQLYVFTHDSIGVGEDGPTHEPIEQLAMIRSIPDQILFRPADTAEMLGAYHYAIEEANGPVVITATRQATDVLDHQGKEIEQVAKGAYVLVDNKDAKVSLLATGSEVGLAVRVQKILADKGIAAKVISMPSWEVFEKQDQSYIDSIIDKNTFRVSIEMASTFGWEKWTGDNGLNIGINTFGKSAPGDEVIKDFGFDENAIAEKVLKAIK